MILIRVAIHQWWVVCIDPSSLAGTILVETKVIGKTNIRFQVLRHSPTLFVFVLNVQCSQRYVSSVHSTTGKQVLVVTRAN